MTYKEAFIKAGINLDDEIKAMYCAVDLGDQYAIFSGGNPARQLMMLTDSNFKENLIKCKAKLTADLIGKD